MMLGKLKRAHHTLCGHFAPAYLGGSDKVRAYLLLIYDAPTPLDPQISEHITNVCPPYWKLMHDQIFCSEPEVFI